MSDYVPYWQKLRDPRWQKKRLEIMKRDEWKCRDCGSATDTLNVHHLYYDKGRDPWDYSDAVLLTLCEGCHSNRHSLMTAIEVSLSRLGAGHIDAAVGLIKQFVSRTVGTPISLDSTCQIAGAALVSFGFDTSLYQEVCATKFPIATTALDKLIGNAAASRRGWRAFTISDDCTHLAFNG